MELLDTSLDETTVQKNLSYIFLLIYVIATKVKIILFTKAVESICYSCADHISLVYWSLFFMKCWV